MKSSAYFTLLSIILIFQSASTDYFCSHPVPVPAKYTAPSIILRSFLSNTQITEPVVEPWSSATTSHLLCSISQTGMALLTNPSPGNGIISKLLINRGGVICTLIYIAGIIWFLALAHRPFNDGTYFSENALLPGLVRGEFDEDITAKEFHAELQEVMQETPNSIPFDWLLRKFGEMSIDAYLHNFTLNYPLGQNTSYQGQNIYAVIRAPRSSSIEGLVVTAPFRPLSSAHPDNSASIAIILALAKFCRKHKYWAKDIIFLITDHEQLGTQAWLEAYHNIQLGNGILNYGSLVARSGSLQAAINLEFHSTKISHIDVKVEGLNGQLPNLDLVNLVHKLCKNEGIRHTFKNRSNPRRKDSAEQQWFYSLTTLISMVLTQASCVPNGNHGLYHRFGIEAVTLEGYEPPTNYRKQISGLYQVGKVLEGILRSLNNLLERFHQSYFFYLLPSNDRFIPIGSYMPSVSLIGAPLLIKSLIVWLRIYVRIKPRAQEKVEKDTDSVVKKDNKTAEKKLNFTSVALIFLVSHLCGWLFTNTGVWLSKVGFEVAGYPPKTSVYIGFCIFFILSINISNFFKFTPLELDLINIIGLLELSTLLLIIAMHNFSLSLILSSVFVPCICFISANSTWVKRWSQSLYMLLIHPFVLVHVIVLGYTYVTQGEEKLLAKGFAATQHSYIYLIIDDMIYANWFLKTVFGFLIPSWILLWTVLHS